MTKHIHDPQVQELIERLKSLVEDWEEENSGSRDANYCSNELQAVIDNYLNQPGPKEDIEE